MARGLAGTRRAYVKCAGCGHSRVRHTIGGTGRCTDSVPASIDPTAKVGVIRWGTCLCPAFIEPKEINT